MFKLIPSPNNVKVTQATLQSPIAVSKGIRQGMYTSGKELVGTLRSDMKAPKSGRTYKIYRGRNNALLKRPRLHRASSPSEVPAVITGEFSKSVDFSVKGDSRLEFGSGDRGLAKKYARALELGTSIMAARKPLGRTVKKLQGQLRSNITKRINGNLKHIGIKVNKT